MAGKDFVLSGVDSAVQSEVDEKISYPDKIRVRGLGCLRRVMFALFGIITKVHEKSDTRGDHEYNQVFMRSEATAVQDDVHDHYRDELTRLAEDHGRIGYVRKSSEAKGSG